MSNHIFFNQLHDAIKKIHSMQKNINDFKNSKKITLEESILAGYQSFDTIYIMYKIFFASS